MSCPSKLVHHTNSLIKEHCYGRFAASDNRFDLYTVSNLTTLIDLDVRTCVNVSLETYFDHHKMRLRSSEAYEPLPTQETTNVSLHGIKPHSATSLAFEMIEQWRQRAELPAACPTRAVIHLLLVRWRVDMVIQTFELPEALMTQITLVVTASMVERRRRRCDGRGCFVKRQELLRDEVIRIASANFGEDRVAVE